jgi:cytochrome b561
LKPTNCNHYDKLSKAFHWGTAIAVVVAFILGPGDFGSLIHDGIDPGTQTSILWHETLGITVFCITLLRLIWVAVRPTPPKFEMALWMRLVSRLMHLSLWALLLALPISALMALGSEANPLTLLGGFRVAELPFISNSYLAGLLDWGDVHKLLGTVIIWLAGIHAFAALYHHFKLKDKVFVSMLP